MALACLGPQGPAALATAAPRPTVEWLAGSEGQQLSDSLVAKESQLPGWPSGEEMGGNWGRKNLEKPGDYNMI